MKAFLGVALALSLRLNVFDTYRPLDMGATVTAFGDEIQQLTRQLSVMEKMFPALLADRSHVGLVSAATEAGFETFPKGDDVIVVETVSFLLSADKVTAVEFVCCGLSDP